MPSACCVAWTTVSWTSAKGPSLSAKDRSNKASNSAANASAMNVRIRTPSTSDGSTVFGWSEAGTSATRVSVRAGSRRSRCTSISDPKIPRSVPTSTMAGRGHADAQRLSAGGSLDHGALRRERIRDEIAELGAAVGDEHRVGRLRRGGAATELAAPAVIERAGDAAQAQLELFGLERLGEEVGDAEPDHVPRQVVVGRARDDDDRQVRAIGAGADGAQDLHAAQDGHGEIEDRSRNVLLGERLECGRAVGHLDRHAVQRPQDALERVPDRVVVIRDEDFRFEHLFELSTAFRRA